MADSPDKPARDPSTGRPIYSGSRVRQGDIILRTPGRRAIFVGGLAGLVVVLLILALLA